MWPAPQRLAREKSDDMRIARGGGWFDGYEQCRSAHRSSTEVDTRMASNGFRVVEQRLDPKHPFHEMPLWRVSDKANNAVEAFLAADKTCRLLTFADIPTSSLGRENPSMSLRFSNWVDLQQADMLTRAVSEGDASGDGIDDALAIVVRGDSDQKLYSVICFNGRNGTGYNPAPFWIVKHSSDFIGKAYVEAGSFYQKYKY